MSKDNFESIISGLMKGPANIESVNFHFGDCNSTTYMGGVEEEYEETCSETCGCCPGDMPVVDNDVVADWVEKKTGLDRATIEKVLAAETDYLEEIGVAFPVDDDEPEDGKSAQESKFAETKEPDQKIEPMQKTEAEKDTDSKAEEKILDEMLDKVLGDVMPGLLCMGLMGAILDDIFNSGKAGRKEQKDGKDE